MARCSTCGAEIFAGQLHVCGSTPPTTPAPVAGEGLRADARALYEIGAGLARQWAEVCAAVGLPDDASAEEVIEAIRAEDRCPPDCVHDKDCAVAAALSEPVALPGLDVERLAQVLVKVPGLVAPRNPFKVARLAAAEYERLGRE